MRSESYRYGFNGKENDNDVKGTGNQQDYGMRIYDSRLGRFLSVDPLYKAFPYYTPYQFSGNTPIMATDKDGGEADPLSWRMTMWAVRAKLGLSKAENATLLSNYNRSANNNYGNFGSSKGETPEQVQSNKIEGQLNKMALAEPTFQYAANSLEFATMPYFIAMPELAMLQAPSQIASGDYVGAAINAEPLGGKYLGKGFKYLTSLSSESKAVKGFNITDDFSRVADDAKAAIENATNETGQVGSKTGGRLGSSGTRSQNAEIAFQLKSRGYTIEGGGMEAAEEYLPPLAGGRKGGSFLDITAKHPNYPTLRINTVTTLKDGKTPTTLELKNAARLRTQIAPGEHLLLIPKR